MFEDAITPDGLAVGAGDQRPRSTARAQGLVKGDNDPRSAAQAVEAVAKELHASGRSYYP